VYVGLVGLVMEEFVKSHRYIHILLLRLIQIWIITNSEMVVIVVHMIL
jgi:hypothetical protein